MDLFDTHFRKDFMSKNFDLPENFFLFNNNDLRPLNCVLDWDTKDKFYFKVLERFNINVLDQPDEHSMVLAVPGETTYFHKIIPAFDLKYIEDCFETKNYPDPTKYVIKTSCPVKYTKEDIFNCWYHQKKSWMELSSTHVNNSEDSDDGQNKFQPTLPKTSRKKNLCVQSCASLFDGNDNDQTNLQSTSSKPSPKKKFYNLSSDNDESSNSDDIMNKSSSASSGICSYNSSKKKTRLPYTSREDTQIVKYIKTHNAAFNVLGTRLWKDMERANVCKIRSWQSMKERYIKHIKYNIINSKHVYPFLTPEDIKVFRLGLNTDVAKQSHKEALKSKLKETLIDEWSDDDTN